MFAEAKLILFKDIENSDNVKVAALSNNDLAEKYPDIEKKFKDQDYNLSDFKYFVDVRKPKSDNEKKDVSYVIFLLLK
ncbi:MAG: hypothetical protein Q4F97_09650 [Bacteroidales bacterium]|nr:hypothetical protein [Bacteroidales bacterium]